MKSLAYRSSTLNRLTRSQYSDANVNYSDNSKSTQITTVVMVSFIYYTGFVFHCRIS